MDYLIKNEFNEVRVIANGEMKIIDSSLDIFLNQLLSQRLSSLEATLKAVRKNLGIAYLTPIYINSSILLFPLSGRKSRHTVYINYHQIDKIESHANHQIIVTFRNKHQMKLSEFHTLNKGLAKCEKIIAYLNE